MLKTDDNDAELLYLLNVLYIWDNGDDGHHNEQSLYLNNINWTSFGVRLTYTERDNRTHHPDTYTLNDREPDSFTVWNVCNV